MKHIKSSQLAPILILVATFILSMPLVGFAQGEGTGPHVTLKSKVQLNQQAQYKLTEVTQKLVAKHFAAEMAKAVRTQAETNVLQQTAQGYDAEIIVINLQRDSYMADLSRIEFSQQGEETKVRKVEKVYHPRFAPPRMKPANPNLQNEKRKLNIDKSKPVPKDPSQYNTDALVKEAEVAEARERHHSWYYARGLANTSTPGGYYYVAWDMTDKIQAMMYARWGGSAAKRKGSESTANEIMDFLRYDSWLLAWNNIGHGSPYGLEQWYSSIWGTDFSSMAPNFGIHYCVVLVNSCYSFKDPLHSHIWSQGPRTYIGGNVGLPVGTSEYVDYAFWYYTLLWKAPMASALIWAQQWKGLPVGTFGLRGDGGVF